MSVPVVIAANGLGMPVRPVDRNAPAMQIAENGLGIPIVISDLGAPFVVEGLAPALPTISITGGTATTFERGGVDYTQIMWRAAGGFVVAGGVIADAQWALTGGGASGGTRSSGTTGNGGGGAGWVEQGTGAIPVGDYAVSIGAGGAPPANQGADGSASTLTGPLALNAPGGGGGGSAASLALAPGRPGGNGGGGAGGASDHWPGGLGDPGFDGGIGYSSATSGQRAGAGGGGAAGNGQDAAAGVPGIGGPGVLLDFVAEPFTAGRGGNGSTISAGGVSPAELNGNGSNGLYGAASGAGGDGFFVLVFPSANATVIA